MSFTLITGGAGFIGTYACRRLVSSGRRVRVLDLRAPQQPVTGTDYIQGDVLDPEHLQKALDGVTSVVHFAALVSVPLCEMHPEQSESQNLGTTQALIKALSEHQKPVPFVFSSTSAVYGHLGKEGVAISEDFIDPAPISNYARHKVASEKAIFAAAKAGILNPIVFRFFNVYGEGQDPKSPYSGVMTIYKQALSQNQALKIFGDGSQTRDFVHVTDVARAVEMALLKTEAGEAAPHPLNVGTGHSITIRALAEAMRAVAQKPEATIEHLLPRAGDVVHSTADIQRIQQALLWNPQISLEAGLRQ